jgi:hypothetical protein
MKEYAHVEPPQRPVTVLDALRTHCTPEMNEHMADPCPRCGGFHWKFGDFACWGVCYQCVQELTL